jgi:hypothetical protein
MHIPPPVEPDVVRERPVDWTARIVEQTRRLQLGDLEALRMRAFGPGPDDRLWVAPWE